MNVAMRMLDGETLQLLSIEIEFPDPQEGQPSRVWYDMTGDMFQPKLTFADGSTRSGGPERPLVQPMFDGQIAGVVISALPLRAGYSATMPMVIPNLGIYWLEITVSAKTEISSEDGLSIPVWEVMANWFNLTDGDIYPPGRDQTGGIYYIAVEPGEGVPHVIEYANSGGVIKWVGAK